MDKVTNLTAVCTAALSHDEKIKNDAEDSKIQEALPPEENIEVSNEKVPAVPAERLVKNSLSSRSPGKIEEAQLPFDADSVKKDYSGLVKKINEEANQPRIKELGIELKGEPITLEDGRTCFEFKAKFVDEFFELIEAYKDQVHVDENFSVILKKNCAQEQEIVGKLYDFSKKYDFCLWCHVNGEYLQIFERNVADAEDNLTTEKKVTSDNQKKSFVCRNFALDKEIYINFSNSLTAEQSTEIQIGKYFFSPFVCEISKLVKSCFEKVCLDLNFDVESLKEVEHLSPKMAYESGVLKVFFPGFGSRYQKKRAWDTIRTYCSSVEMPSNEFGLKNNYWSITLGSVSDGLKKKLNDENLSEEEKKNKIAAIDDLLNLVRGDSKKLANLFMNTFFGDEVKFYWTNGNQTDEIDVKLGTRSCENECGDCVYEQDFVEHFKNILEYLENSRVIKEYLVLLIIVKKYFYQSKVDLNFVLLDNELLEKSAFGGQSLEVLAENKPEKLYLRIAKFCEDMDTEDGLIRNFNTLLVTFHEFGHFLFQGIFGDSADSYNVSGLDISDFGEDDPEFNIVKELGGITSKMITSRGSAIGRYDSVWHDKKGQFETAQILGTFLFKGAFEEDSIYSESVLVKNKYNDFALRQGVCDALHTKGIEFKRSWRTSHLGMPLFNNLDESKNIDELIKSKSEVIENFSKKAKDLFFSAEFSEIDGFDLIPIQNMLKMIENLSSEEILKIVPDNLKAPLSEISKLKISFDECVSGGPELSENIIEFYAKLYSEDPEIKVDSEQLKQYAEDFRKFNILRVIEDIETGKLESSLNTEVRKFYLGLIKFFEENGITLNSNGTMEMDGKSNVDVQDIWSTLYRYDA